MSKNWVFGAVLAFLCLIVSVQPARAVERYHRDLGWGVAAVGAGLLYSPAKVAYAIFGGVVGGLTYAWTAGDVDVAHHVWSPTIGGTYVVTPAMLRGEEPILFAGETYGW